MKKSLTFLCFLLLVISAYSQVPEAFNYQAVVRNSSGDVIANTNVSFRISILLNSATGTSAYIETQTATTNGFGLVNLKVGKGTKVSGSFTPDSWGTASHFMKVEVDPAGGSSYTQLGTTELLSVPYAFHAQTVENNDDADADATNEIQTLSLSGTQLSLSKNGGTVTLPTTGGTVGDNWGTQTVVTNGVLQGQGVSGNPLIIAQNGAIFGQVLKWDGTDWLPAYDNTGSNIWTKDLNNIYYKTGNVGIGTENPEQILDIYKSSNATAKVKSGGNAALELERETWLGKAYTAYKNGNTTTLFSGLLGYGTNDFSLSFDMSSLKGLKITQAGDTYLSGNLLLESGKIGIGTSTPTEKLDVNGYVQSHYGYGFKLYGSGLNGALDNDGMALRLINYREEADIQFCTTPTGGPGAYIRMYIEDDGNIGIGNVYPRQKLHVSDGNIMIENNYGLRLFNTTNLTDADGFTELITAGQHTHLVNRIPGGGLYLGVSPSGTQSFRLIIDDSGNVGVGTVNPEAGLHVFGSGFPKSFLYIQSNSGQDAGIRLYESTTAKWHIFNNSGAGGLQIYNSAAQTAIFCKQSNSYVGLGTTSPTQKLHVVGNAYKTEGGTSWATSSDIRLKNLLGSYNKGLNEIISLEPVRYIYKKDNPRQLNSETEQVGFVAQEVQKIFPEAVTVGEDGYLDFNIHPINIAYVNAIKELKNENDALKSKVDNLESRLEQLEALVEASAKK